MMYDDSSNKYTLDACRQSHGLQGKNLQLKIYHQRLLT